MKEMIKLGLILFLITAIAAGILSISNELTAPIIEEVEAAAARGADVAGELIVGGTSFEDIELALLEEIKEANDKVIDVVKVIGSNGESLGYGIRTLSTIKGYGGDIELFVGIKETGEIGGIRILSLQETPGLGTNVENASFKNQFIGVVPSKLFEVVKVASSEEHEIATVAGATISSLSFTSSVNNAMMVFDSFLSEDSSGDLVQEPEDIDLEQQVVPGSEKWVAADDDLINKIADQNNQFVDLQLAYNSSDEVMAYVITTWSVIEGYYGHIELMVGVDLEGAVTGMVVLTIDETPGLGTNVERSDFQEQFIGKPNILEFQVKGSANNDDEIAAISGATVSSRSFTSAINNALEIFNEIINQ